MANHIIKSVLLEEDPYVVKVPEPLFTIKDASSPKADEEQPPDDAEQKLVSLEDDIVKAQAKLEALKAQAENILEQANAKRDKIIAAAHEQAEEIKDASITEAQSLMNDEKEKGHAQGLEEGRTAGLQEVQKNIDEANEKAQRIVMAAQKAQQACLAQSRDEIVDTILSVAQKVMKQKFDEMPQLVLRLLQGALDKVKDQPEVTVKVSANAYEFALLAKQDLQSHLAGNATLNIVADDSLAEGECWVETPNGDVDSSYSSQLKVIKEVLHEAIQKGEMT